MKEELILGLFTTFMSFGYALYDYSLIKKEIPITRDMKKGRFIERFAMATLFMLILQKTFDFSLLKYCVGLVSIGFGFWFWFDLYLNSMRGKKWYYTGENSVLDRFKSESPKVINICILLTYSLLFTLFVILK